MRIVPDFLDALAVEGLGEEGLVMSARLRYDGHGHESSLLPDP